jgi:hypothetical protein
MFSTRRILALLVFILAITLVSCGGRDEDAEPTRVPTDPAATVSVNSNAPDSTPEIANDQSGLDATKTPEDVPQHTDDVASGNGKSPTPTPTPTPTVGPTETPAPEPPLFAGYDLEFSEGDFWRFRWEYTDRSCAQGSGCKTTEDEGVFQLTLGEPKVWDGVTVYRVLAVGETGYFDDPTTRSFVPGWEYLGVDGHRIVATDATGGSPLVTLFDARTGIWAGSGFFAGRFPDDVLVGASPGQLTGSHEFASWDGVETGPWHSVSTASSGGECSTFDGRILCPSEEKFDYTETEYYRPGVGPFAYIFNYSASFSGGGFTSSFQTQERVALIASSFTGDDAGDFGKPTPTPSPTPTPTPVVLGEPIFGPFDGQLLLDPNSTEIPEFPSGVNIDAGVVEATFENPDVTGNRWSHGIIFRNSIEEAFHAVFITGDGQWGHFARGGSVDSQVTLAIGQFDFDTAAGAKNTLTVWFGVHDENIEGVFLINDQEVVDLNLSFPGALSAGDVAVVSGLFPSDEFTGAITKFTDFTVYEKP